MAFERLEPFGSLHDELLAGQICAVQANVHRDPNKRPDPWTPADFGPALKRALQPKSAILLDDPEAQSTLLANSLFAGVPKKAVHARQDDGRPQ